MDKNKIKKIDRREFIKFSCLSLGLIPTSSFICCDTNRTVSNSKPNIVIILADDLGYGDLGCYGNKNNVTTNIDHLSENGMKFCQFYSNAPVCAPARAALLTGKYPQNCNGGDNKDYEEERGGKGLGLNHISIAELVKTRGYVSGCFGKWHLGEIITHGPIKHGFDESYCHKGDVDYHSHISRDGKRDWWKGEECIAEEGYASDLMTDHAIEFIEKFKKQPFLLYLPYLLVHNPLQGPTDPPFRTESGQNSMDFQIWRSGDVKDKNRAYRDMVHSLDANIGRILNTLDKNRLKENTLIFFVSDNGCLLTDKNRRPPVGSNGVLRGEKKELFEGGIRVPVIAFWPGKIKSGAVTQEPAMIMDIFPTVAELTGALISVKKPVDGVSLLPLLLQEDKLPKRSLFWRSMNQECIRNGKWKLLNRESGQYLFDLENDVSEKYNLFNGHPEIVKQLQQKLGHWKESLIN